MKVKNLKGTSDNKCFCKTWLDHWNRFSAQKANRCVVDGCSGAPEVGGHVQKDSSADMSWYIIPICSSCNANRGEELSIHDGVNLVPARVAVTCGRGW